MHSITYISYYWVLIETIFVSNDWVISATHYQWQSKKLLKNLFIEDHIKIDQSDQHIISGSTEIMNNI